MYIFSGYWELFNGLGQSGIVVMRKNLKYYEVVYMNLRYSTKLKYSSSHGMLPSPPRREPFQVNGYRDGVYWIVQGGTEEQGVNNREMVEGRFEA